CRLRQAQRVFRLSRIEALTVLPEVFAPREMASRRMPTEWRVLARFAPEAVRWVQEAQFFGFAGVVGEDATRGTVMAYEVGVLDQIARWLLGWGSQVEVLEPPELRAELAQTAARLVERYR